MFCYCSNFLLKPFRMEQWKVSIGWFLIFRRNLSLHIVVWLAFLWSWMPLPLILEENGRVMTVRHGTSTWVLSMFAVAFCTPGQCSWGWVSSQHALACITDKCIWLSVLWSSHIPILLGGIVSHAQSYILSQNAMLIIWFNLTSCCYDLWLKLLSYCWNMFLLWWNRDG